MKYALIVIALLAFVSCEEARKRRQDGPFAALDHHLSHTLAYLWPWSQLIKAFDSEDWDEPKIQSDSTKFAVGLNVKNFKPDELRVKVKNRHIIVEGKHKEEDDDVRFVANHFVQRIVLPPGSKPEEVSAVLNEKGVLTVSAPKHELPPPPPEREVPIEVRVSEVKTLKPETVDTTTQAPTSLKTEAPTTQTTLKPIEQLDLEPTTHAGKIRKKELKSTTKTTKDNEVEKGVDGNNLDYALVEGDE